MSRRRDSWIIVWATGFALAAQAALAAHAAPAEQTALGTRAAVTGGTAADTGQIATLPGRGCDGRDASRLQNVAFPSLNVLGHSTSITAGFRIADDFTLSGTTQVDSVTVYAWGGTSTPQTCGFDDMRVVIRSASPAGANSVVFGDLATNRLTACAFSNIYRDSEANPGDCSRPVMALTATIGTELAAGTYWLDFEIGESAVLETYVPL